MMTTSYVYTDVDFGIRDSVSRQMRKKILFNKVMTLGRFRIVYDADNTLAKIATLKNDNETAPYYHRWTDFLANISEDDKTDISTELLAIEIGD